MAEQRQRFALLKLERHVLQSMEFLDLRPPLRLQQADELPLQPDRCRMIELENLAHALDIDDGYAHTRSTARSALRRKTKSPIASIATPEKRQSSRSGEPGQTPSCRMAEKALKKG